MPDEIDIALKRVTDSVAAFDENPCMATAADAEWKLSILKILVGIDRFDHLNAFARALKTVSDFIDKNEEESYSRLEDALQSDSASVQSDLETQCKRKEKHRA